MSKERATSLDRRAVLSLPVPRWAKAELRALLDEIGRHPDAPGGYIDLASALLNNDQFDIAMKAIEIALCIDPRNVEARLRKACIYQFQNLPSDAMTVLDQVAEALDGQDISIGSASVDWRRLGQIRWSVLTDLGRFEEALELAIRRRREPLGSYGDVLKSLIDLGRFSEAESLLGERPEARVLTIHWIAVRLGDTNRIAEAYPFLVRRLATASLPRDLAALNGYIEYHCITKQFDEVVRVVDYWLAGNAVLRSDVTRRLTLLRSVALANLGQTDAWAFLKRNKSGKVLLGKFRSTIEQNYFEATYDLIVNAMPI